MTAEVSRSIRMLDSTPTKILVSTHQPNLFAYGGIFKKIVLLQTLKETLEKKYRGEQVEIVNLFLIIDHDFMDENWMRVAQLPSVRHSSGIFELRLPVDDSMRWKLVRNMSLPARTVLEDWKLEIISWISKSSCSQSLASSFHTSPGPPISKSHLLYNLEQFWKLVETSYSRAETYSDFNAYLMSDIVNSIWGYDTLFVRITDISSVFQKGYKFLLSNLDTYSGILSKTGKTFRGYGIASGVSPNTHLYSPLWLHCTCGSKAATMLNKQELIHKHNLILEGRCMACKKYLNVYLGEQKEKQNRRYKQEALRQRQASEYEDYNEEDEYDEAMRDLSPRAIPIPLLLSRELGIECYISGIDGMRYIIYGSRLFRELAVNPPLFMVWPARDIYYGFAQKDALDLLQLGKEADIVSCIRLMKQSEAGYDLKIQPVLAERARRAKAGESIEDVLLSLYSLKKDQRKIRSLIKEAEKVKNAVEMRPSIIDYAVNFGLANTEMQWHQNLLNNNDLDAAINMTVV